MNIHEGNFLWNMETGIIKKYEYLASNKRCDTLVIGGGITGALTAYMQAKSGAHVIIVDKNILGYGATLKTDGVLLREMDITNLKKKSIDNGKLLKYNKLCSAAMENILNIISEISEDEECKKYINLLGLKEMDVMYYSNKLTNKYYIYKLFERLGENNNKIEYLEQDPLLNLRSAILIPKNGYTINPYLLTALIYMYLSNKNNVEIYENTYVEKINAKEEGVECTTSNRFKIDSKCVILACGINTLKYMENNNIDVYKQFTIVTERVDQKEAKNMDIIAKNISNTSTIVTFTKDNRIILSGENIKETERLQDKNYFNYVEKGRYKRLYQTLNKVVPLINPPKVYKCFYSMYLETKDMLPIIDELENMPNVYVNLSVGKNGIVESMIGANMLKDVYKKYHIKDMYLFRENRW